MDKSKIPNKFSSNINFKSKCFFVGEHLLNRSTLLTFGTHQACGEIIR